MKYPFVGKLLPSAFLPSAILLAVLFGGCMQQVSYHSTAHYPRQTTSISTWIDAIPPVDSLYSHGGFSVMAAVDDSAGRAPEYYIILLSGEYSRQSLDFVLSGRCGTILPSDIPEVTKHLGDLAAHWDDFVPDSVGQFYEFTTQTVPPASLDSTIAPVPGFYAVNDGPDELGWIPAISITCNHTSYGANATLRIGTPRFLNLYRFIYKSEVLSLKIQLEDAVRKLHARGMP
jgi:hypothetical protein